MPKCPFDSLVVDGIAYKVSGGKTIFVQHIDGGKKKPVNWRLGMTEDDVMTAVRIARGTHAQPGMSSMQI